MITKILIQPNHKNLLYTPNTLGTTLDHPNPEQRPAAAPPPRKNRGGNARRRAQPAPSHRTTSAREVVQPVRIASSQRHTQLATSSGANVRTPSTAGRPPSHGAAIIEQPPSAEEAPDVHPHNRTQRPTICAAGAHVHAAALASASLARPARKSRARVRARRRGPVACGGGVAVV
ncbi:hypothetical protein F511_44363 [Dorcoceras hygrometricum]|uniref:Uncharacterized protein n=1 Tax=Dorcoceras hygrometricum TaxID=472368 RepID=A0A2Z7A588_9LAMI|nr:hypothetical protein F511_44363 [Dorcoceras hygrometricum]